MGYISSKVIRLVKRKKSHVARSARVMQSDSYLVYVLGHLSNVQLIIFQLGRTSAISVEKYVVTL